MRALIAAFALVHAAACGSEAPRPSEFPATVVATLDGETPMAGVRVETRAGVAGETDPSGALSLSLHGLEGAVVPVGVRCPDGHRVVRAPGEVRLRTVRALGEQQRTGIQIGVECAPLLRAAVLVVRASGQGDLPVLIDDDEVTRTSSAGIAHVAFRAPPGTRFVVELDTDGNPELRPHDPRAVFVVPDAPELFVFDQPFEAGEPERPVRPRRRRPPPGMQPTNVPMRL